MYICMYTYSSLIIGLLTLVSSITCILIYTSFILNKGNMTFKDLVMILHAPRLVTRDLLRAKSEGYLIYQIREIKVKG